ncbi:MAG: DNA polymerase III subunit [Chloroflexota bacterium]|nr:DNA polymerase III subunit [Chloroflexota bacterium]
MSWTVVGQDAAITALSAAVARDRIAHAYLFAGPEHTGKTLTALQFAQRLNCTGEQPPCGRCRQCEHVASMTHADVEIVGIGSPLCDPRPGEPPHDHSKDDSRDIRICQVRRLERVVSRAPFEGRHRVMIIEPAAAMNEAAANALLKTLEEPPDGVVLILITDREEMLLPTIRSRARRIGFAGQPPALIERTLRTRWDVGPEQAAELARMSGGHIGWAVVAMHDKSLLEQRREALDVAQSMTSAPLSERFAWAAEVGGRYTRDRGAVQATLEVWQAWWRDILLIAAGRDLLAVHSDRLDTLRPLAAQCDVRRAVRALRAIADARVQLTENATPVLALEMMTLALPRLQPNAVSGRLAAR